MALSLSRSLLSFLALSSLTTAHLHKLHHAHLHEISDLLVERTSSLFERAATLSPAMTGLPSNWTYVGCYGDKQGSRTLNGSTYADNSGMNATACISYCAARNYVYAGTEYSSECYCGQSLGSASNQSDSSCNMACSSSGSSEACGAGNLLSVYYANKAPSSGRATAPGPPGWTSYGCIAEGNDRALANALDVPGGGNNMSVEACTAAAKAAGYSLAGVEYGSECYGANYLSASATNASASDCAMQCSSPNVTEICGGPNRLNLYAAGNTVPSTKPVSAAPPPPAGWINQGCYNDSVNTRTLSNAQYGIANMTVERCAAACFAGGYQYTGLEYGSECYCSNQLAQYAAPVSDGRCDTSAGQGKVCQGNSNETCGGPNGLSLYQYTGWLPQGCYNDSVNSRTLSTAIYGLTNVTNAKCSAACKAQGFIYSGTEYSSECYCGSSIQNFGAPVLDGRCSMTCQGAGSQGSQSNEICGGPNGLSIYMYNSTGVYSSSSSSAAAGPTSTGGTATAAQPTPTPSVPTSALNASAILPFTYQGCFTDNSPSGRTLMYQQPDNSSMTIESCISACSALGYSIAGMEYSTQCFCDRFIRNSPSNVTANGDCSMTCGGNKGEYCGAGSRLSIYSNGTMTNYTDPTIQKTGLGNWTYAGCYTDVDGARTLPYEIPGLPNNTNSFCTSQCQKFGYGVAATEYGEQCYCGDWQNVIDAGATLRPDSECQMVCTNDTNNGVNGGHYCGGGSRLSLYTWNGTTPLTSWTFAQGSAAGAYRFLIGGLIIPLVAAPARNGKVTFLEKFGTEPANNSTGAYELDVSLVDNFTAAWRPMHVKSDVFCSASLTLPDRAGRQVNIGGWANPDTHGVRFYWPDGSPGVPGKNDWEENGKEVALITGRWYPSAMIMANGSVLVVGGEVGSNGAPVGDLEVLPSPSGQTVPCDYLTRTDPYSTYPFLAVLPSGGILVAYYNEARILDPVSLTTQRSLPNIPGAVNDFDGGRTYPFEGTAMLLPQYAPYSDPLKVIICGGSVPGPEIALDNCVTIAPDVPDAEWQIERMPSKRVITCMTALPDGTYLIVNGAHQGRAGFGLATDPNYNAVLYDPTKPLNARMTVMANTTVARLYHSEAVLLDDGRVLISGSDPEDERAFAPQEYRNEVFIPPYLMNNQSRPSFNVSTLDWSYGQQVSLTVTPSGNRTSTTGYRVSLIGATASTHGNSMGQRTFFPAISCSGLSCTVTAPPNANICPPSWFQMFVLDANNIPSTATWVRIGGDPASLGNYPPYSDFHVPGQGPVIPLF